MRSKDGDRPLPKPDLLKAKIKKYGRERLDRNRMLIDFDYIPTDIRSRIIQKALLLAVRAQT